MNSNFQEWLDPQIRKVGGFSKFCEKLKLPPMHVASWVQGVAVPKYAAQLKICEALGCSLKDLRSQLGQDYSIFAEFLIVRILPYGKIIDFPRKTGIKESAYQKWLNGKSVPLQLPTLDRLADALILWGDPNPKPKLMAELIEAAERSIATKKRRLKIAKDCDFDKIAA
jgi:transcriptional regulator with XRE-family HTH domain